jgi:hypothetical protein
LGPLSGMGEIEESFTERTFELGLETWVRSRERAFQLQLPASSHRTNSGSRAGAEGENFIQERTQQLGCSYYVSRNWIRTKCSVLADRTFLDFFISFNKLLKQFRSPAEIIVICPLTI